MFLFKGKKEAEAAPVSTPKPVSQPVQNINPDDFFKDMGRRPKRNPDDPIEAPEITGLREAPEAAPEILIKNIVTDEAAAEMLADKTIMVNDGSYGNIRVIDEGAIDVEELDRERARKAAAPVQAEPEKMVDPDDFFKNMGRRAKRNPDDPIEQLPEITGLREAPEAAPVSSIGGIDSDSITTAGLRDKTLDVYDDLGNISVIDESKIDLSGLREEIYN